MRNPTLVEILRNSKIIESESSDDLKRKIADAMSLYLDNHPALHSNEVKAAFETLNKESEIEHYKPGWYSGYYYFTNGNPFIRTSREFKSIKIGEAVSLTFAPNHPGCNVSGRFKGYKGSKGRQMFYKDEQKLKEYIRERCSDSPSEVIYDFKLPRS